LLIPLEKQRQNWGHDLLFAVGKIVCVKKNMSERSKKQPEDLVIRFAEEEDAPIIVALIKELAAYEKLEDKVQATEALVKDSIFRRKAAEVLIGEYAGEVVAYAVFFQNFSTFAAQPGIFIEDIYVKPHLRRKGFGRRLFMFMARLAVERGYARIEWTCLDWNTPSIAFYRKMGAEALPDWTTYRLSGEALRKFVQK
jgi:GNAT superfamily N-acetyltransferase